MDAPVIGLGFWSADRLVVATAAGEIVLWNVPAALTPPNRRDAAVELRPPD